MTTKPSSPADDVRGDFFREAANTLKASRWTLLLAHLFGRKHVGYDTQLQTRVTMIQWRGVLYMTDFQQEKPNG